MKFKIIDYLEEKKVFACTFKDMKKYFLKRESVLDNVDADIAGIIVDESGYHFTIKYVSGDKSVVPWDSVKSICDEKYKYFNK